MSNELASLEELSKFEKKQKQLLVQALDTKRSLKDHYFAHKVNMGDAIGKSKDQSLPSYVSVQNLSFVAEKILMGSQMPFMREKLMMDRKSKEFGKFVVDDESIETLMQRAPDWTRQMELTAYLLRDNHKFTSILAVAEPSWINDPESPNYGEDGRALKDAISYEALTSDGSFGILNLENLKIFALDGQHRVMAILGIRELLNTGQLTYKDKAGISKKDSFEKREFLIDKLGSRSSALTKILDETISIEFIPAILQGETRDQARIRLRNYFVDINKNAKKIQKGDEASLDETDGYKIVARNVGFKHPILVTENVNKINRTDQSIPKASNYITTGFALSVISENYLKKSDKDREDKWKSLFKNITIRPSEEELEKAKKELTEFFDHMASLSVFKRIERGESIPKLREFPEKDKNKKNYEKSQDNMGHLLLRPIGQQILAEAVGSLVSKGSSLKAIFEKVEKIDSSGHFNTHQPSSIFYGVTVDIEGKRMLTNNQLEAAKYLEYLLAGETNPKVQERYLSQIIEKRSDPTNPDNWKDFNGDIVPKKNKNKIYLPKPFI